MVSGVKLAPVLSEQLLTLAAQCMMRPTVFAPEVSKYTLITPVVSIVAQSVQNSNPPGTTVWQLVPVYPEGQSHVPLTQVPPFWHTTVAQLPLPLPAGLDDVEQPHSAAAATIHNPKASNLFIAHIIFRKNNQIIQSLIIVVRAPLLPSLSVAIAPFISWISIHHSHQ